MVSLNFINRINMVTPIFYYVMFEFAFLVFSFICFYLTMDYYMILTIKMSRGQGDDSK